MDSTTFAALVSAAADCFYIALRATEDPGSFLRTIRNGTREAAARTTVGKGWEPPSRARTAARLRRAFPIRPKRYDPGIAWPGACLQGLGSLPWFHEKNPVRPTCSLLHVGSAPVKVTHTILNDNLAALD